MKTKVTMFSNLLITENSKISLKKKKNILVISVKKRVFFSLSLFYHIQFICNYGSITVRA